MNAGRYRQNVLTWCIVPFFTLVVTSLLNGQNSNSVDPAVSEPQYLNSFAALGSAGKLTELERNTVSFKAKTKVLPGYATVKMAAEFKPAHASVRLPSNTQFIVRGRSALDPVSRFQLRVVKTSKDHREILITQGHGSLFGGGATSSMDEGTIPIRFEEYGSNSYRITPEHPLQPGEYALAIRGMGSELYCFGVDQ